MKNQIWTVKSSDDEGEMTDGTFRNAEDATEELLSIMDYQKGWESRIYVQVSFRSKFYTYHADWSVNHLGQWEAYCWKERN